MFRNWTWVTAPNCIEFSFSFFLFSFYLNFKVHWKNHLFIKCHKTFITSHHKSCSQIRNKFIVSFFCFTSFLFGRLFDGYLWLCVLFFALFLYFRFECWLVFFFYLIFTWMLLKWILFISLHFTLKAILVNCVFILIFIAKQPKIKCFNQQNGKCCWILYSFIPVK